MISSKLSKHYHISLFIMALMLLFTRLAYADHTQSCQNRSYNVADRFNVVCSATWQFVGKCTGKDLWNSWAVSGQTRPKDAFVHPWLTKPITIVGYDLVKLMGDGPPSDRYINSVNSWFMVGSAVQPDAFLWLAPGENHAKQMWNAGLGQPWPSTENFYYVDKADKTHTKNLNMLDIHGICFGGEAVTLLFTIYYSPEQ